jgi:hypothetical protein
MDQKKFSIIKAFEFGFDALVQHSDIFGKLVLLIGLPIFIWYEFEKIYVAPRTAESWQYTKEYVRQSAVGKKLGLCHGCALEAMLERNKILPFFRLFGSKFDNFQIQMTKTTETVAPNTKQVTTTFKIEQPTSTLPPQLPENSPAIIFLGIIVSLVSALLFIAYLIFSTRLCLDFYDFRSLRIAHALRETMRLLPITILAHVLYQIVVAIGFLLFIIPCFILAMRYFFAVTFIIDGKAAAVGRAFHLSSLCTNGTKWRLFAFTICVGIIEGLATGFSILLLFTTPLVALATIYVYRTLLNQTPEAQTMAYA